MKRKDHCEKSCTRKRAFKTRDYAEMFLSNVLKNEGMVAYHCRYCRAWHLGHPTIFEGRNAPVRERVKTQR